MSRFRDSLFFCCHGMKNGDVKTGPSYRQRTTAAAHRSPTWVRSSLTSGFPLPGSMSVEGRNYRWELLSKLPNFFWGKKDEQISKTTFMETLFWSTMFGHSRISICILCTLFLAKCHISIWQSISQCYLQLLQLFSGFHLVILDYVSAAAVAKVDKKRSATNEDAWVSTSFWWLTDSTWLNFIKII